MRGKRTVEIGMCRIHDYERIGRVCAKSLYIHTLRNKRLASVGIREFPVSAGIHREWPIVLETVGDRRIFYLREINSIPFQLYIITYTNTT